MQYSHQTSRNACFVLSHPHEEWPVGYVRRAETGPCTQAQRSHPHREWSLGAETSDPAKLVVNGCGVTVYASSINPPKETNKRDAKTILLSSLSNFVAMDKGLLTGVKQLCGERFHDFRCWVRSSYRMFNYPYGRHMRMQGAKDRVD